MKSLRQVRFSCKRKFAVGKHAKANPSCCIVGECRLCFVGEVTEMKSEKVSEIFAWPYRSDGLTIRSDNEAEQIPGDGRCEWEVSTARKRK